ncbi:TPA: hypothetical protein RFV66_004800 [Klebsiella aerogenes]|nr:hypothetical protein [Klebsiella aerogenes]
MGTYIRTCAELKIEDGWQPIGYGAFPPVLWHDMDEYEAPAYSEPFSDQNYGMFAHNIIDVSHQLGYFVINSLMM